MFLPVTRPFESRDIPEARHSPDDFLGKVPRVTQEVPFNGRWQGKLRVMKIEIKLVSDVPDDFDEKSN
jgi:hypothetical protein